MTSMQRFFYGGVGAFMPVLVTIVSLDLAALFSKEETLTVGNILGVGIRYIILFFIGGFVAFLHTDETKPFKLFELGVAAPALITSIIAAGAVPNPGATAGAKKGSAEGLLFPRQAYAAEIHQGSNFHPVKVAMLKEIFDGITGSVYKEAPGPPADWVPSSGGQIPPGAVKGGKEPPPGEEDLYVCRAQFKNGIHPGKVRLAFGGCNISWGGKEYTIHDYQVLTGSFRWLSAKGGEIPAGALKAGKEDPPGREDLYVCRARFKNGVHPGKVRREFGGCNIGWGGTEQVISDYEVLVR